MFLSDQRAADVSFATLLALWWCLFAHPDHHSPNYQIVSHDDCSDDREKANIELGDSSGFNHRQIYNDQSTLNLLRVASEELGECIH